MKTNTPNAITATNISKTFREGIGPSSFKNLFVEIGNRILGRSSSPTSKEYKILKNINFEVKEGDFFGIVGRNGSGKSTLLKIIAGIYNPSTGGVNVNGKLTPFIELGVGFNPELSGKDNVYLNSALLGFNRKQIDLMYDDIVDFAELHEFMNMKLKHYSSGMQVRLAFSVAIRAQSDILLIDEVLAVGDSAFQQKCFDYFSTLKRDKKTVVLVSHSMSAVERFCNKAMLIENGEVIKIGKSKEISTMYENLFSDDINKDKTKTNISNNPNFHISTTIFQNNKKVKGINALHPFSVQFTITSKELVASPNIGLNIRNAAGNVVYSQDFKKYYKGENLSLEKGKPRKFIFDIDNYFTNGKYYIDLIIVRREGMSTKPLLISDAISEFSIFGIKDHIHGMFHPNTKVRVE